MIRRIQHDPSVLVGLTDEERRVLLDINLDRRA
jgi:hypothetical protein